MLREEMAKLKTPAASAAQEILTFDNLEINLTRREVLLDGQVLALKPQEYDLLLFFAQHNGQMLSREFILERVWGWDYIGDSRTVDVHVRWLRQKIEQDAGQPAADRHRARRRVPLRRLIGEKKIVPDSFLLKIPA